ncbi:MAG: Hsp33 family molecular chaperone HslO [Pseudomonadota bacterium]|nr:Hsp33 family molecular chaperone HslO [Pseudomonadota bacterium]
MTDLSHSDKLLRFSFDKLDIRGELVYLDASWTSILARHSYPQSVRKQLGDALAAVALLSATVKFDGTMILQVQGNGPLRSLVAQITSGGDLRGLARWEGIVPDGNLLDVYGEGRMLITITKTDGERYQSIVALEGDSLASALNVYFHQSEQLPSRFQLYVDDDRVGGLFLQALPTSERSQKLGTGPALRDREEDWNRITLLAGTLADREIFAMPAERLLLNLFHEEDVHLHSPKPLRFACTCSRAKVERTLIAMGEAELRSILRDEGAIKVDCEFCNQHYGFDAADVDALCSSGGDLPAPGSVLH